MQALHRRFVPLSFRSVSDHLISRSRLVLTTYTTDAVYFFLPFQCVHLHRPFCSPRCICELSTITSTSLARVRGRLLKWHTRWVRWPWRTRMRRNLGPPRAAFVLWPPPPALSVPPTPSPALYRRHPSTRGSPSPQRPRPRLPHACIRTHITTLERSAPERGWGGGSDGEAGAGQGPAAAAAAAAAGGRR
ncbi:hypothetical protein DFH09DRAFT_1147872 [Mycena vulgaris]|nr:hypothetical protein DFH09DRAFT_1147872 [Mycena vulgaris]